jgi:hypothetical protein
MSDKKSPIQVASESVARMKASKAADVLDAFDRTTMSILDRIEGAGGDDCIVESEVLMNVCEARSHWIAGNALGESPPVKTDLN